MLLHISVKFCHQKLFKHHVSQTTLSIRTDNFQITSKMKTELFIVLNWPITMTSAVAIFLSSTFKLPILLVMSSVIHATE